MPLPAITTAGGILLRIAIPYIIAKVFILLGLGFVTYTGIDFVLQALRDAAMTAIVNIPPEIVGLIGLTRIDVAVNIVLSALAIKTSISFIGGSFTKLIWI